MNKQGTAKLIKNVSKNFQGHAALYRLDPPIETVDWKTEEPKKYLYVIVSAASVPFSGNETYIFPADSKGKVISWTELDGSYRGGLDHEKALGNAGYSIK